MRGEPGRSGREGGLPEDRLRRAVAPRRRGGRPGALTQAARGPAWGRGRLRWHGRPGRASRAGHGYNARRMVTLLAQVGPRSYVAEAVGAPSDFASPFVVTAFPCLLWDHGSGFSGADRAALARTLLDAGCRYVVCGGEHASQWECSIDEEFVRRHLEQDPAAAESGFVMTTSHEGETPDDVAFFFVMCTNYDGHDFERHLVLHVGVEPENSGVDTAVRAYAERR